MQRQLIAGFVGISQIAEGILADDLPRARHYHARHSAELKNRIYVALLHLSAIRDLDDTQFKAIVDSYRHWFPDTIGITLKLIAISATRADVALLEGSFETARRWTAKDTCLRLMVAPPVADIGQVDRAQELAENLNDASLDFKFALIWLVQISLAVEYHVETPLALRTLGTQYKVDFPNLSSLAEYERFVRSPYDGDWLEYSPDESNHASSRVEDQSLFKYPQIVSRLVSHVTLSFMFTLWDVPSSCVTGAIREFTCRWVGECCSRARLASGDETSKVTSGGLLLPHGPPTAS